MLKVLIVEDNQVSQKLLALNFSREGYSIVLAKDGAEGLAKTIAERPPLVVTDLQMPEMHGSEMIREIRRRPEVKGTKVIVLTGQGPAAGEEARQSGADAILYKPLTFESLYEIVQQLLSTTSRC
jgi:CheY-like chemotaxis protein